MTRPHDLPCFELGNDFFEIGLMAAASGEFAAAMGRRIAEAAGAAPADHESAFVAVAADAHRRDEHGHGGQHA